MDTAGPVDGDGGDEHDDDPESEPDSADEPLTDEEDDATAAGEMDTAEWGVGAYATDPNEPVPQGEETARLALVDLDWGQVRAVRCQSCNASTSAPHHADDEAAWTDGPAGLDGPDWGVDLEWGQVKAVCRNSCSFCAALRHVSIR
jgi:hypothetical protein